MGPPIIDFSRCGLSVSELDLDVGELRKAGNQLFQAFSTAGFAYIVGGGIERNVVEAFNSKVNVFFAKPREYKIGFYTGKAEIGYDKIQRVSTKLPYDRTECFHVAGAGFLNASDTWPDVPGFEQSMKDFAENACKPLAHRLLHALGLGMKLKDPLILEKSHKLLNRPGNLTAIKVNNYPAIEPSDVILPNQMRACEHTDWGTITLLFQDEIGGLQIRTPSGDFIDVEPIPDTIVLNVGDMLSLWSENNLKSTVHRVVIPDDLELRNRQRRSVSYFVNADDSTVLSKLEYEHMNDQSTYDIKDDDTPEILTAEEFFRERFKMTFTEDG